MEYTEPSWQRQFVWSPSGRLISTWKSDGYGLYNTNDFKAISHEIDALRDSIVASFSRPWPTSKNDKGEKVGVYTDQMDIGTEVDTVVMDKVRQATIDKEVAKKMTFIEAYGNDPFTNGDVLRFTKRFAVGAPDGYLYAAIKVDKYWYTTGPRGAKFTWDEFVAWLVAGSNPVTFDEIESMTPSY